MHLFKRFLKEEDGQDMIEYGLLGALISIVAVLTVQAIGALLPPLYQAISNALTP